MLRNHWPSPASLPSSRHPHSSPHDVAVRFCYLDVSNILLGAQQVAAHRNGLAASPQLAASQGTFDSGIRLGLARLRNLVLGTDAGNTRAVCVLSTKPGVVSTVAPAAAAAGWQVLQVQRATNGREKEADTTLAVEMVSDVLSRQLPPDAVEITLMSGDRDFCPALATLTRLGFPVDVMAWGHSTSHRLAGAASRFLPLDPYFELITYHN